MAEGFFSRLARKLRSFGRDRGGQVAIVFAISAVALVTAVGAGLDISRAFVSRQEISHVATMTCQYATRPSVTTMAYNGNTAGYTAAVNSYAAQASGSQGFQQTPTHAVSFNYVQGGVSSVTATATYQTVFAQILGVTSIPLSVTVQCSTTPAQQTTNGAVVLSEGFENSACSGSCWSAFNPSGGNGYISNPVNTPSSTTAYVGSTGTQWIGMGYCLEIDTVGVIRSTVAEGSHSAELNCDNGSGSAGRSSISTKTYLTAGSYELRYNYASRVSYPNYDPAYICGSTASDVSWANDTNSVGAPVANALRNNQINVYLDQNVSGVPPTHTTIDGTQTLAGSNLIDVCVTSSNWIQRSVKITVTTTGYYWLSFAADGQNDSFGGQLDNIMLCRNTCSGTVQDNFPPTWVASNKLFEDTFDTPTYTPNNPNASTLGNLNLSLGTSGASSGWPGQTASGWATASYNQMDYILAGAAQGSQNIELDASNPTPSNRTISRPFVLDPGYYEVDYNYISGALFPGNLTAASVRCNSAPSASTVAGYANPGSASANIRYPAATMTVNIDTNLVGVFMSHGQLVSTPVGGGALNSQTSFLNPDGTITTTPTVSPSYVSIASYNTSQVNPLIDSCFYAPLWQARTTYVKITKPGIYWLSFAALGTSDLVGGNIDDVKLKAFASPYGTAPSFSVTIPTPSISPGSSISYTGFSIVADSFVP